jgi:hypothetical protein
VQFEARAKGSSQATITIRGEASGNAAPFTTATRDVSSRTPTTASATWTPPSWSLVGERAQAQRTTDLTDVVQEIVGRPSWSSGHALVLVLTGAGASVAQAFEAGAASRPTLHLEFVP